MAPVYDDRYYCLLPRKLLCFGTAARFFKDHLNLDIEVLKVNKIGYNR